MAKPDLPIQQPCNRRPIVCLKCRNDDRVEIQGEEYHCGRCGNYAFVGRPTRWPFAEVVKKPELKNYEINKFVNSENDASPLQVGESLAKKEEKTVGAKPLCKREGCEKVWSTYGYCNVHFREEYGITAGEYNRGKTRWHEDPREVAARLAGKVIEKPAPAETKGPEAETKQMEPEMKVPDLVSSLPDINEADKDVLLHLYSEGPFVIIQLEPEIKDALRKKAKAEYRTVELEAAYLIDKGLHHGL